MLKSILDFLGSVDPTILIIVLVILFLVSVFGNVGIDWKNKKFVFGSQKTIRDRSCIDCISILMAQRTNFETKYNFKRNSCLRQQMIFVEHKLVDIEQITGYELHSRFKDEIRRSFKDNGFEEMNKTDYNNYIQERIETLTTQVNCKDEKIKTIIKEMYDNAKSVKSRVHQELIKLETEFDKYINDFTSNRKNKE